MLTDMLLIIALFSVLYTFIEKRRISKEFERILRQLDADLEKARKGNGGEQDE